MAFVGALDQGTTSTRFLVVDETGTVVTSAQRPHAQHFPRPGWVEHDATEILENTWTVIAAALDQADLTAGDLAAVGITNQRETLVVWDPATGQPLHQAIVWQDTRTTEIVDRLADGDPDRFRASGRDDGVDEVRPVSRDVGDLGAALGAEEVEELAHRGARASRRGPDEAACVMVDDHHQGRRHSRAMRRVVDGSGHLHVVRRR